MCFFILLFILALLIFHGFVIYLKERKKIILFNTITEYLWLTLALTGIITAYYEVERMGNNKQIERQYYDNWGSFNQVRMRTINAIEMSNYMPNYEQDDGIRWLNILWKELERGYNNELWRTIVYSNYDILFPPEKNAVRHLSSPFKEKSDITINIDKTNPFLLEDIRSLINDLEPVRVKWENQFEVQKKLSKKTYFENILRNILPYMLSIILALRISKVYAEIRLRKFNSMPLEVQKGNENKHIEEEDKDISKDGEADLMIN